MLRTAAGEKLIVYCGVIDVLQQWRLRKKTEHALKSAYYLSSSAGVSVVPPGTYKDRFVRQLLAKFTPAPDTAPADATSAVAAAPDAPAAAFPAEDAPAAVVCVRYLSSNTARYSVDL